METLDFVYFVDREHALNLPFKEIPEEENRRFEHWNWDLWKAAVNLVTGDGPKFLCDNHARSTGVFGVSIFPSESVFRSADSLGTGFGARGEFPERWPLAK
jgi:hypothetical protein